MRLDTYLEERRLELEECIRVERDTDDYAAGNEHREACARTALHEIAALERAIRLGEVRVMEVRVGQVPDGELGGGMPCTV